MEPENQVDSTNENTQPVELPNPDAPAEEPNLELPNLDLPETAEPAIALPAKKNKKPLVIALICFLVLAIGGSVAAVILLQNQNNTQVADSVEPTPEPEVKESELRLVGNGLSGFPQS